MANLLCCLALFTFLGGGGCTHESSEEDAHLEHVIPPHKPKTYADTVTQLDLRWSQLQTSVDPLQLSELKDIVHWLPELAADSDLDRSQWEQVQALTANLEELHVRLANGKLADADRVRWQEIVATLRELVPDSDERDGHTVVPNLQKVRS